MLGLLHVALLVATETLGSSEAFVTPFPTANMIADAVVAISLVTTQMVVALEVLAATGFVANEWTLPGVRANVFFKATRTAKSSTATFVVANIRRRSRVGCKRGTQWERGRFIYCVVVSLVRNDEHIYIYIQKSEAIRQDLLLFRGRFEVVGSCSSGPSAGKERFNEFASVAGGVVTAEAILTVLLEHDKNGRW